MVKSLKRFLKMSPLCEGFVARWDQENRLRVALKSSGVLASKNQALMVYAIRIGLLSEIRTRNSGLRRLRRGFNGFLRMTGVSFAGRLLIHIIYEGGILIAKLFSSLWTRLKT